MAVTPFVPRNRDRVWRKIISVMQGSGTERAADLPVGAAIPGRMKRRVWLAKGTPDTNPTGIVAGDFILDTTNDEVYRWISSGVWIIMTAESN